MSNHRYGDRCGGDALLHIRKEIVSAKWIYQSIDSRTFPSCNWLSAWCSCRGIWRWNWIILATFKPVSKSLSKATFVVTSSRNTAYNFHHNNQATIHAKSMYLSARPGLDFLVPCRCSRIVLREPIHRMFQCSKNL